MLCGNLYNRLYLLLITMIPNVILPRLVHKYANFSLSDWYKHANSGICDASYDADIAQKWICNAMRQ